MFHCLIFSINFVHNKKITDMRSLGAYRIATVLRDNDWDAEVIDYAAGWNFEELKSLALLRITSKTKFIGLSNLFYQAWTTDLELFLSWFKINYPHIKIISGSQAIPPTINNHIDFYISGWGDYAILELLKYLFSNGKCPKFIIHKGKKLIPSNDFYLAAPMTHLKVRYEKRDFINQNEWLHIETSRGCKFACAFCNFPILGVKGDYTRDSLDFKEEISKVHNEYGVSSFMFSDDTFNDSTEKISKYADVIEKLDWTPTFGGGIRADLLVARPKDKQELVRLNFINQFYGIETFNEITGKIIGKGMNPEKLKNGLIDVTKYFQSSAKNYRGHISLIVGLPNESLDSIDQSKKWLVENWQGQSFNINALEIFQGDFDRPSKISIDYKKYGYENFEIDTIFEGTYYGNNMIWKNQYTNVVEASKIAEEINMLRENSSYDFRLGPWELASIGISENNDERFLYKFADKFSDTLKNSSLQAIKNYIEKKLSL